MKPDRTIIRLSFPHPIFGTFTPIRVEYEYPLGPNDSDQDALDDGKRRAEEWFTSRYPPVDGYAPPKRVIEPSVAVVDNGEADAQFEAVRKTMLEIIELHGTAKAKAFLDKSSFKYHPELKALLIQQNKEE